MWFKEAWNTVTRCNPVTFSDFLNTAAFQIGCLAVITLGGIGYLIYLEWDFCCKKRQEEAELTEWINNNPDKAYRHDDDHTADTVCYPFSSDVPPGNVDDTDHSSDRLAA